MLIPFFPVALRGALLFGVLEIVLIFGLLIFFFGARKIPGIAKGLGEGIRNFKGSMKEPEDEERERLAGTDEEGRDE